MAAGVTELVIDAESISTEPWQADGAVQPKNVFHPQQQRLTIVHIADEQPPADASAAEPADANPWATQLQSSTRLQPATLDPAGTFLRDGSWLQGAVSRSTVCGRGRACSSTCDEGPDPGLGGHARPRRSASGATFCDFHCFVTALGLLCD